MLNRNRYIKSHLLLIVLLILIVTGLVISSFVKAQVHTIKLGQPLSSDQLMGSVIVQNEGAPTIEQTVAYINKALAENAFPQSLEPDCMVKDEISLSPDKTRIIIYNDQSHCEHRRIVRMEAAIENLNPERVHKSSLSGGVTIFIDCKNRMSCAKSYSKLLPIEDDDDDPDEVPWKYSGSSEFFIIKLSNNLSVGERLENAFVHLIKSVQQEIQKSTENLNDPFVKRRP
jgi:hypothetical protein